MLCSQPEHFLGFLHEMEVRTCVQVSGGGEFAACAHSARCCCSRVLMTKYLSLFNHGSESVEATSYSMMLTSPKRVCFDGK